MFSLNLAIKKTTKQQILVILLSFWLLRENQISGVYNSFLGSFLVIKKKPSTYSSFYFFEFLNFFIKKLPIKKVWCPLCRIRRLASPLGQAK
jgi:hypothetical protein